MNTNLEAGRELNVFIAREIYGWMQIEPSFHGDDMVGVPPESTQGIYNRDGSIPGRQSIPRYTESIDLAMAIIEYSWSSEKFFWSEDWALVRKDHITPLYQVIDLPKWAAAERREVISESDSAAVAICLAVRKAIGSA